MSNVRKSHGALILPTQIKQIINPYIMILFQVIRHYNTFQAGIYTQTFNKIGAVII